MATETTDPYAEFQPANAEAKAANSGVPSTTSSDPYSEFTPASADAKASAATPKEPGMLETANKAYEGEPAKPMALSTEYAGNALRRLGSAAGRTLMVAPNMAVGAYHAIADAPTEEEQKLAINSPVTGRESLVGRAALAGKRMLYDPSQQAIEQEKQHEAADAAAGMPHSTTEKVMNRAVSAVPMMGPYVEGEGQRAGKGDILGAAGDVAGMEALGQLGHAAK